LRSGQQLLAGLLSAGADGQIRHSPTLMWRSAGWAQCLDPQTRAVDETLALIGDHLRRARLAAGLTQEKVADLAGISRPRYRDVETGVAAARTTTLINIARAV